MFVYLGYAALNKIQKQQGLHDNLMFYFMWGCLHSFVIVAQLVEHLLHMQKGGFLYSWP